MSGANATNTTDTIFLSATHSVTRSLAEPTQDVLQHTISFMGNSRIIFNQAVEEVRTLIREGGNVYPPRKYPTWRNPKTGTTLQPYQESDFVGRLYPAEAVGVKVLQDESLALNQAFGKGPYTAAEIDKRLGTGNHAWQSDAIDAIVQFNHMIAMASGVRERIQKPPAKPTVKTLGDRALKSWYEIFKRPLIQDKLEIGHNVAARIVKEIVERARKEFLNNPEGANGQLEIEARIEGRRIGAQRAYKLYLETVKLASYMLPDNLEPNNIPGSITSIVKH